MDIRNFFKIQKTKKVDNVSNKPILGEKKINKKENEKEQTETNVIEVFTDGSTFNNGQKNKMQFGGIGIYFNQKKYPSISEFTFIFLSA